MKVHEVWHELQGQGDIQEGGNKNRPTIKLRNPKAQNSKKEEMAWEKKVVIRGHIMVSSQKCMWLLGFN